MPYSVKKPADMKSMKEKLQKTYKNISDTAARQAIHVWNSVMEESDDEGRAWASVYAALNKRGLGKKAQENPMSRTLTASDRSSLIRLASTLPKGSPERKAILNGLAKLAAPRRRATTVRTAGKPDLPGLNLNAFRAGLGWAGQAISLEKNNSKFYEMMITENPTGGFTLTKQWGALTDRGGAGRKVTRHEDHPSLEAAQRAMARHIRKRENKPAHKEPYVNVFRRQPVGQYTVGLSRNVGFGWGTQEAAFCTPALRDLLGLVEEALQEAKYTEDPAIVADTLDEALGVVRDLERSDIKKELDDRVRAPLARLRGQGRFRPDLGRAEKELARFRNYLRRQLDTCNV